MQIVKWVAHSVALFLYLKGVYSPKTAFVCIKTFHSSRV